MATEDPRENPATERMDSPEHEEKPEHAERRETKVWRDQRDLKDLQLNWKVKAVQNISNQ